MEIGGGVFGDLHRVTVVDYMAASRDWRAWMGHHRGARHLPAVRLGSRLCISVHLLRGDAHGRLSRTAAILRSRYCRCYSRRGAAITAPLLGAPPPVLRMAYGR